MTAAYPIDPLIDVTGLVLAGGRGSRMGGVDKGLQIVDGDPLAFLALQRLAPQVAATVVNANRNTLSYEFFGVPVLPDSVPDHPGPLAGFLAGLACCQTAALLTVPCDAPRFPADLARRLCDAMNATTSDIVVPSAPALQADGRIEMRPQPVFCLMRTALHDGLDRFLRDGGRKIMAWTALHRTTVVPFDLPGDAADAFFNANTTADLRSLAAAG